MCIKLFVKCEMLHAFLAFLAFSPFPCKSEETEMKNLSSKIVEVPISTDLVYYRYRFI